MEWNGVKGLLPKDWRWFCYDRRYVLVITMKHPAATNLLKIIHCSCATACTTSKCSWKKNEQLCTTSCMGRNCENCEQMHDDSDEDIDKE